MMEKELTRLERLFGGLKALRSKPDAILVIDAQKEKNCVHEAVSEKIDIIALIDSNTDPSGIKLPIPANDDALSSVKLIVTELLNAYGNKIMATAKKEEVKEEIKAETPVVEVTEVIKEEAKEVAEPAKTVKKVVTKKAVAVKKAAGEKKTPVVKKPVTKKIAKKEA